MGVIKWLYVPLAREVCICTWAAEEKVEVETEAYRFRCCNAPVIYLLKQHLSGLWKSKKPYKSASHSHIPDRNKNGKHNISGCGYKFSTLQFRASNSVRRFVPPSLEMMLHYTSTSTVY